MKCLSSLDWRVLFALPVLSVLLGVVNNLRVPEDQQVRWSGERVDDVSVKELAAPDVKRGVWTSDFQAATNAAITAHIPVVVVVTQKKCDYCARLHKALDDEYVKSWQKERDWYFVLADKDDTPEAAELTGKTPTRLKLGPYGGVYWTRADGTRAMRNFPCRQGMMGVQTDDLLAREWIRAVEASVPGAPGVDDSASSALAVRESKKPIAATVKLENGAAGRVKMSPPVKFLKNGRTVVLTAEPRRGSVFVGWRYPDGRLVYESARLKVDFHSLEGTYTAVFRRMKDCVAPVLNLPEKEVAWTECQREELKLCVNTNAYPVVFACKNLPPGMKLLSRRAGVISGRPQTNGVWRVEVAAKSMAPALPVATGAFTVRVSPGTCDKKENGGRVQDGEVD